MEAEAKVIVGDNGEFIPVCEKAVKPVADTRFKTLEEGINFYEVYGVTCGFDTRRGPLKRSADCKVILRRYVYCNKEGSNPTSSEKVWDVNLNPNRKAKVSRRTGCMARVILKFDGLRGYVVESLYEGHNHVLASDRFKHFLKYNRNIDESHQSFVLNCVRANVGPARSFRLYKEMVGSYENVGCTKIDFKNYARDLRAFAVGADAQVVLDKMYCKRELNSEFRFDYCVDGSGVLTRLFWADATCVKNYKVFGDHVSFDATYRSNKYNLIFTPFTGRDNHGKCISFGAGLLNHEDIDSYVWLFEKFLTNMGSQPKLIITDQDPSMRKAVPRIFQGTRHRFCMWHIMEKVDEKVSPALRKDEYFKKILNRVVWSELIEPLEFEQKWGDTLDEFGLTDHKWFSDMYELREHWVPAYFRDFPLSGLFRMTSMSESVNSVFRRDFNSNSNLIEFFMHYDGALDTQRNGINLANSEDESCFPVLKTTLLIEKHAASVYTLKAFRDVQIELLAARDNCAVLKTTESAHETMYVVDDDGVGLFIVTHDGLELNTTCECKLFMRMGLLCRHVLIVFKCLKINSIPDKYIVTRWTKLATQYLADGIPIDGGSAIDEEFKVNQKLFSEFHSCIAVLEGDREKKQELLKCLIQLKEEASSTERGSSSGNDKMVVFSRFYGADFPAQINVKPPAVAKNKGSGSRLKSRKEKALKLASKPMRQCKKCNKYGHHDSRNCTVVSKQAAIE